MSIRSCLGNAKVSGSYVLVIGVGRNPPGGVKRAGEASGKGAREASRKGQNKKRKTVSQRAERCVRVKPNHRDVVFFPSGSGSLTPH